MGSRIRGGVQAFRTGLERARQDSHLIRPKCPPDGIRLVRRFPIALHIEAARAELESRGISFIDAFDTGVCHNAFFEDPDGNALLLHHRYAPRVPEA